VDVCHDGEDGAHSAMNENYDAIILDLQLPGATASRSSASSGERKKSTAVIILTARDTVKDRVRGLDEGADDYLVKPFALDELRARVRAMLRRGKGSSATVLQYSTLSMNLLDRRVLRGDPRDHPDPEGIRAAGVLPPESQARPHADVHCGACLELRVRLGVERRRRVHQHPAEENRGSPGVAPDPHRARVGYVLREDERADG